MNNILTVTKFAVRGPQCKNQTVVLQYLHGEIFTKLL